MFSDTLLIVFGIVLIVEGVPWFLSPRSTKRTLSELFRMSDQLLRGIGLTLMLCGLLLVYLVRSA